MKEYTENDVLRLAKRLNNEKRQYLLIDPLQAKHMPVSPTAALDMMDTLGELVARRHPSAKLVIGFAETATAIGSAVACRLGNGCIYIHTTRERLNEKENYIVFREEHSHAAEQLLCVTRLEEWTKNTPEIIFVDDELSTGKTLINIIERLREFSESFNRKKITAVSVINRMSAENERRLGLMGIRCECLVRLPDEDYTDKTANIDIRPATVAEKPVRNSPCALFQFSEAYQNPRYGVYAAEYKDSCEKTAKETAIRLNKLIPAGGAVLVLGTEEFMYPSLVLGATLEKSGLYSSVRCHATTRSPIGISDASDYPISSGYELRSFYDPERITYIYNIDKYSAAVIFTDASKPTVALDDISAILHENGCENVICIKGGAYVQYI